MTASRERGKQALSTIMIRASLVAVLLAATFGLLPEKTAAQEAVEAAGTVVDDGTGEPIEGATVRLADPSGSARETITGPDGTFAFPRVAPGEYTLAVRRLGYEVLSAPLEIGPRAPPRLDVRLQPQAIPLEPLEVGVEGRPPRLAESGFYDPGVPGPEADRNDRRLGNEQVVFAQSGRAVPVPGAAASDIA